MSDVTHAELVARAERWLRNTMRCGVVLTEASGTEMEVPDAIGWRNPHDSIIVECKVSRSDFFADAKKPFRLWAEAGLGRSRYFMTPKGLILPSELPPRWGLLEVTQKSVRQTAKPRPWKPHHLSPTSMAREMSLLLSELRKFQIVQGGGTLNPSASGRRVMGVLGVSVVERTKPKTAAEIREEGRRNTEWLLAGLTRFTDEAAHV